MNKLIKLNFILAHDKEDNDHNGDINNDDNAGNYDCWKVKMWSYSKKEM